MPESGIHEPIRMRASVVLPEALGPITPSASPGSSVNVI